MDAVEDVGAQDASCLTAPTAWLAAKHQARNASRRPISQSLFIPNAAFHKATASCLDWLK
jgi:hypothetical protein